MSNIKQVLRNSAILAAVTTLAVVATAASEQTDPGPSNLQRHDPFAGEKIADLSRWRPGPRPAARTGLGRSSAAAVHKCRFRINSFDRHRITGPELAGSLAARIDQTYGALFPVGNPAPAHRFAMIFLGDDQGLGQWRYPGTSGARCTLLIAPYGKPANFQMCSAGSEWEEWSLY